MGQSVITVAQQKGGAGKTTVTVHLAVALSQRGLRVAIIDIDPQGSLTHWHGLREKRYGKGYTGMHFSALSGWRVSSEVARLRKHFDVILIDSPPHVETEARAAIRQADLLLIPVQPSPTDLWATKATLELARAEKIPMRVIFNRVNVKSRITDKIGRELDQLARSWLANRVVYAAALLEGQGVTEVEPRGPAAAEIKLLVQEVLSLLAIEEIAPAEAMEEENA